MGSRGSFFFQIPFCLIFSQKLLIKFFSLFVVLLDCYELFMYGFRIQLNESQCLTAFGLQFFCCLYLSLFIFISFHFFSILQYFCQLLVALNFFILFFFYLSYSETCNDKVINSVAFYIFFISLEIYYGMKNISIDPQVYYA